jgi:YidC/Oxa1 family membrane protein insertase
MFEPLFDALASVMNFFYTLVPNYGFAIMGLTVAVMLLITPLTVKSTRSMLEMQRLQPEMKKIQEKYKDDRERLNQELMAFYQEHKINPLGGCLPLVAQMPVFIIMYQLMRGLTVRPGGLGTGIGHIGGQSVTGTALTPWEYVEQFFRPDHLDHGTEMYQALSNTSDMNFLGFDLSLSASQALQMGLVIAIPYLGLLLFMLITGIVQNRQLQSRNKGGNVNPQQQMIMKFMPFFLPIFSFGFPAGLALYWCTQNLCRIGTNAYITRSIYHKEHARAEVIETTGKQKSKASGSKGEITSNGSKAKAAKDSTKQVDRGPGKSVKSQKAHEKSGGVTAPTTNSKQKSGQRRRSGERRGGSTNKKD